MVFRCVVCGDVEGAEGGVLGYAAPVVGVSVVVLQVGAFLRVEHLPGPRILLLNLDTGPNLPEILGNRLKELIFSNTQAQILRILQKNFLIDRIRPDLARQLLDHQDSLLYLVPHLVVIFAACLDVRMAAEVQT